MSNKATVKAAFFCVKVFGIRLSLNPSHQNCRRIKLQNWKLLLPKTSQFLILPFFMIAWLASCLCFIIIKLCYSNRTFLYIHHCCGLCYHIFLMGLWLTFLYSSYIQLCKYGSIFTVQCISNVDFASVNIWCMYNKFLKTDNWNMFRLWCISKIKV